MSTYASTCPDCGMTRKINVQDPARRCRACTDSARKDGPLPCGHEQSDLVPHKNGRRYCLPCKRVRDRARDYALRKANQVTLPLPPPPTDARWNEAGACFGMDTNIFYPERGWSAAPAKRICSDCPIRLECLSWAMEHTQRIGIWGGLNENERDRLRGRMNRERAA